MEEIRIYDMGNLDKELRDKLRDLMKPVVEQIDINIKNGKIKDPAELGFYVADACYMVLAFFSEMIESGLPFVGMTLLAHEGCKKYKAPMFGTLSKEMMNAMKGNTDQPN